MKIDETTDIIKTLKMKYALKEGHRRSHKVNAMFKNQLFLYLFG